MTTVTTTPTSATLIKHPTWCHSHGVEGDLGKVYRLMAFGEAPAESDEEHTGQRLQLDCGHFAWTVRTVVRQGFEERNGVVEEGTPHVWMEVQDNQYVSAPTEMYFRFDELCQFIEMLEHHKEQIEFASRDPRLEPAEACELANLVQQDSP